MPKLCPWTGSWKLTLYDKSFNCSILMNERKETVFAFDPHGRCCQSQREGDMVGGPAKWWPLKPCGISDMWLGYVNTCNYLIQQVLSLQLRTGCSSSWIRFRIVIPESCLIYVWQITTSLYAFFLLGTYFCWGQL